MSIRMNMAGHAISPLILLIIIINSVMLQIIVGNSSRRMRNTTYSTPLHY